MTAGNLIPAIFYQVIIQFAIVTVIFTRADRHFKKHPESWNYRDAKQADGIRHFRSTTR